MLKSLSLMTGVALVFAVHLVAAQDRQPYPPPSQGGGQSAPKLPEPPRTPTPEPSRTPTASQTMQADMTADQFLKDVSQSNRAEIELGQLAQSKASNAQVKSFAQMLVNDHTKANQEAMSIARTKNVDLPNDLKAEQKSTKEQLDGLSGASFDRQFIDTMVQNHQKGVAMFERASKLNDAQVKSFAEKTLPTLRHHLEEAQRLQKTIGAGASNPSSGK